MQIGGFRGALAGTTVAAILLGALAGCKSNAGSAVNDEGTPTTDTGYISAATTGGDAAGTANMKLPEEGHEGSEHGAEQMQGGRASKTPQQQGGGAGG
jgi:hypothetical protein